jgi:MFS family permease
LRRCPNATGQQEVVQTNVREVRGRFIVNPPKTCARYPHGVIVSGESAARSMITRWRWSITATFGLGGIAVSTWGPRLPAIKSKLAIDTGTIGLLLGTITVGAILGLIGTTAIRNRFGSRLALGGALLIIAVAMTLMGLGLLVGSIALVAVALLIFGVAIGVLDVLINVEGSAIEQEAGRTFMPGMHAAWSIGAILGSAIGAACAALDIAPTAQFIAEGVLIAGASFAITPGIPRGIRKSADEKVKSRRDKLRLFLSGWLDVRLLLIGVVMLGVELGEGSAGNWLTLAVHKDHGQTVAIAALYFTAFACGEALARIFGGPIVDRLGRVRTIRATTALGIVGVILFITAGNRWLVLIGVVAWAIGVSMGFPLGMSAAAESGADSAARVSVVASIGYFANLAGPPAIGALAERVGLLDSLWVLVVLFGAAFAVAGSLRSVSTVPK